MPNTRIPNIDTKRAKYGIVDGIGNDIPMLLYLCGFCLKLWKSIYLHMSNWPCSGMLIKLTYTSASDKIQWPVAGQLAHT